MDPSKPSSVPDPQLLVRCETWREFVEQYANDVSSGGMFVATDMQPEALSTLDVHLQLPEATEIVLRARIVHVLSAEHASMQGKAQGVGLELLDLDAERKRQLYQLIEFARWQGASNDPNASFARTLLEISTSMPPAEVGQRLSLLPGAGPRPGDSSSSLQRTSISSSNLKRTSISTSQLERSDASSSNVKAARVGSGTPEQTGSGSDHPGQTGMSSSNLKATSTSAANIKRSGDSARLPRRGDSVKITALSAESSSATKAQASDAKRPSDAAEPRAASVSNTNLKAANDVVAPPATPPKPTDQVKLKLALTEFAHKHYEAALRTTREMLESNPGDPQALRWQHMCHARLALARNDALAAADQYEQALAYDEDNREAREFVRNTRRDKKLNSLPFGRYFTKKK